MPVVLYKRQRQVLDFIVQYIQKHGHSPTLREIADALGLSAVSTVHEHITALEEKGVIKRNRGKKTGFKIIDEEVAALYRAVQLPILGYFADGHPIEQIDEEEKVEIPQNMIDGEERAYLLKVKNNQLETEGILKDDLLIIEEKRDLKDGKVAVLILEDGGAVIRKMYQEATRIRLEKIHSKEKPEFVFDIQLQGKVSAVIRQY
jgi:repressor LexA